MFRLVEHASEMDHMEHRSFESWLAAYGRAWQQRDVQASAGLFTDDATYHVTPFEEIVFLNRD